jgi:hypothetical protein
MASLEAISIPKHELRDLLTYAFERGRQSTADKYLSIAAACRETGKSRRTIQEAIENRKLNCSRVGDRKGCSNLISATALKIWIDTYER